MKGKYNSGKRIRNVQFMKCINECGYFKIMDLEKKPFMANLLH